MYPSAIVKESSARTELYYCDVLKEIKQWPNTLCKRVNSDISTCLKCGMLQSCSAKEVYLDGEGIVGASY